MPAGLVGGTEAAARSALNAVQLKPAIVGTYTDSVPKGQVISTVPSAGKSAAYGSKVEGFLSHGPILVQVPDLTGLTIAEAQAAIQQTGGLGISISGSEHPGEVVVDQDPKPLAMVPLETTTVTLFFGHP